MNLLTDIRVKGEVFLEYAFLSCEFIFENNTGSAVSAEYMFNLPKGALISDMKIIDSGGRVIRTSVVSLSHAEMIQSKSATTSAAYLRRIDDLTYSLSLGSIACGGVTVRLSVYAPVRKGRLIIPFAHGTGSGEKCQRQAQAELLLHNVCNITSATHNINIVETELGTQIKTDKVLADRDFCLCFERAERKNAAVAVQDGIRSEILYRVYPGKSFFEAIKPGYKKLLLIYDATGSLQGGAAAAAREYMCEFANSFGGCCRAVALGDELTELTRGFEYNREDCVSDIKINFGRIAYGEPSQGVFERLGGFFDEDTLAVLICGTEAASRGFENLGRKMCVVTLGGTAYCRAADEIACACGGKRAHIFGGDVPKKRSAEIIRDFTDTSAENISVSICGAEAEVVGDEFSEATGVTVYARSLDGETVGNEVELVCRGKHTKLKIERAEIYKSFAPVGLVYAENMYTKLKNKLSVCDPVQIQKIRSDMETLGIKYSAINSETALVAVTEGKTERIHTVIPGTACRAFEVFGDDTAVFRENSPKMKLSLYIDFIIRSMRGNGAICSDGVPSSEIARYQTAICCLALSAADCGDMLGEYLTLAEEYIGDSLPAGLCLTRDKEKAYEILSSLFKNDSIYTTGIPDILTAAKLVWQMSRKKDVFFC